jgi:CheY-like chemotaxis protein
MTTVLVVDDSAVDRVFVGGLLAKDGGLTVRYAVDGSQALAFLVDSPPDIVVSDMLMPHIDGLELVSTARSRFPLVPVILMTSQGSEEIAVRALQAGAASYVPKRQLVRDLLVTLHKVLLVSSQRRGQQRLMGCMTSSESTFLLGNDASLFGPLIAFLQESASQMGICTDADRTRLGVALEEALANALFHGNLEVSSELREAGSDAYYGLIENRRKEVPYCDRQITVHARLGRGAATFVISDGGCGFDFHALPDPTDPANLERAGGRGILLMRTFMDDVIFNAAGNEVTLIKRRGA